MSVKKLLVCNLYLIFLYGFSAYAGRPDITNDKQVVPQKLEVENLKPSAFGLKSFEEWEKYKNGQLELAAEILEMYPHYDIYIMSRDADYLGDFMKVITQDTPHFNRIHYLNVSRSSARSENLKVYLEKSQISEANLGKGRRLLLVDVGLAGSALRNVQKNFPNHHSGIQAQFITSENPEIPSGRVFLASTDFHTVGFNPALAGGEIRNSYEELVKFEHTAIGYSVDKGNVQVLTQDPKNPSGDLVGPDAALKLMQDLKFYAKDVKNIERFQKQRALWGQLRSALEKRDKIGLKENLLSLIKSGDPLNEALVRDFLEVVKINFPAYQDVLPEAHEIGLKKEISIAIDPALRKELEINPKLEDLFADPRSGSSHLIELGHFEPLHKILPYLAKNPQIIALILDQLVEKLIRSQQTIQEIRPLIRALISIEDQEINFQVARILFNENGISLLAWKEEMETIIFQPDKFGNTGHYLKSALGRSNTQLPHKEIQVYLQALDIKDTQARKQFLLHHKQKDIPSEIVGSSPADCNPKTGNTEAIEKLKPSMKILKDLSDSL